MVLKVYEEHSYRKISQITGLSEGNVGYILHHAMKKLSAALKDVQRQERTTDISNIGVENLGDGPHLEVDTTDKPTQNGFK